MRATDENNENPLDPWRGLLNALALMLLACGVAFVLCWLIGGFD